MPEETKIETVTTKVQSRRAFVKTAAQVAVTAPAAAVLLNASVKPANARTVYDPKNGPFGDDTQVVSDDGFSDDFQFVNEDDTLF